LETIVQVYSFTPEELSLTTGDVLQNKAKTPLVRDTGIDLLLTDLLAESAKRLRLRAGWVWDKATPLRIESGGVALDSLLFNTGDTVAEELRGSDTAALFAISCGDEFDRWSNRYFEVDDPLAGYLSDSIGLAAMDKALVLMLLRIEQALSSLGLSHSSPFSPGWYDWPCEENLRLASALPEGFCGLRFALGGALLPVNSRCGIIGIGRSVQPNADLLSSDSQADSYCRQRVLRRITGL